MSDKNYGTDQNDNQSFRGHPVGGGTAFEIDGQNGESARRVKTPTSPGDTASDDLFEGD